MNVLVIAAVTVAVLSGCQSTKDYEAERLERLVKLAKICEDAGGTYDYNAWSGYECLFEGEDATE